MDNRRRHYRIYFSSARQGKIELVDARGRTISGRLVDLSAGGVKCSVANSAARALNVNDFVERLLIYPRISSRPILAQGILRRKQPSMLPNKTDLAFEFSAVYSEFTVAEPPQPQPEESKPELPSRYFLSRLRQVESPHAARSLKQRQIQQMHLRRAFSDIAANLSREERWWFYIVLEALKHSGAPLQKGLLAEYLKLCQKAVSAPASPA